MAEGEDDYSVVIFGNTFRALRGQMVARRGGFEARTIPTPRNVSTDCGVVLRIKRTDEEAVVGLFRKKKVKFERVEPLRPGM